MVASLGALNVVPRLTRGPIAAQCWYSFPGQVGDDVEKVLAACGRGALSSEKTEETTSHETDKNNGDRGAHRDFTVRHRIGRPRRARLHGGRAERPACRQCDGDIGQTGR